MIEGIPLGLADLSGWGLLVLLVALNVVGLFRGWVVPKPFYDLQVTRCDKLETTVDTQRETINTLSEAVNKQSAVGNTVVRVVSSMQDARAVEEASNAPD